MTDEDAEVSSSVIKDEVVVYQTYATDQFDVPTVVLKLVSEREVPVVVQLVVRLPPQITEVGIHPDYYEERWTVTTDKLEFRTELEPDEEVTTMYAIKSGQTADVSELLDSLYISDVQPLESAVGADADEDDGLLDTESPTAPDEERDDIDWTGSVATDGSDGEVSEPDSGAETPDADATGDVETETDALSAYSTATLVSELDDRLDAGDISVDEYQQLRERILTETEDDSSLDLRVAHLQQRLSDAEAFIDSVQHVHDEHGPLGEVFDRLQADVDATTRQTETLADTVDDVDERVEKMDGRLESLEQTVQELDDSIERVDADVDAIRDTQEQIETDVSNLQAWKNQVASALKTLGESE